MFELFEAHEYYSLSDLKLRTKQPEGHLKSVLTQIAEPGQGEFKARYAFAIRHTGALSSSRRSWHLKTEFKAHK